MYPGLLSSCVALPAASCVFSLASFSTVWSASQALCALRPGRGDWHSHSGRYQNISSQLGEWSSPLSTGLRSSIISLLQGELFFFSFSNSWDFFSCPFQPMPLPASLHSSCPCICFFTPASSSSYTTFSPRTIAVTQIQDLCCICSSL